MSQHDGEILDGGPPPGGGAARPELEYTPDDLRRLDDFLSANAGPEWIGRYRILQRVGAGGMGEVYKAEQTAPIRRVVAIKLIKQALNGREIIARFQSERQALAHMDHPNVARVLDAGEDAVTGRPYVAMEYVPGQPITRFCDERRLTIRQRLELFTQVCDAVGHAHQKMIVHRDLKPSNILVTESDDGKPVVKVIDFGLAKALVCPLGERTLATESGQLLGTPEYMSPEQAGAVAGERGDVDTRSDIYSLGVTLYELLAGALPFDSATLRSSGLAAIERTLREVDPPRPSARLDGSAEVARNRRTRPEELRRQLRGELEWIPLKAMRKERQRRYATATQFAQDIENYLQHRPLIAGPESKLYRFRKFARRNRNVLAATTAVALILILGTVSYVRGIRVEQDKTQAALYAAQLARDETEAVNEFLTGDLLDSARPAIARGRDLPVSEVLANAAQSVGEKFKHRPLQEATVRLALARIYRAIGRADLAVPQAEIALARRRALLGNEHASTLEAISALNLAIFDNDGGPEAEALVRELLEKARRILGEDHPLTLDALHQRGYLLYVSGDPDGSEPFRRAAFERRCRVLGEDHLETLSSQLNLGALYREQGRLDAAEPLLRDGLERATRVHGQDHPATLRMAHQLALLYQAQRRNSEADALLYEVVRLRRAVLGDNHPHTLRSMRALANLYETTGRAEEAVVLRAGLRSAEPATRPTLRRTVDDE